MVGVILRVKKSDKKVRQAHGRRGGGAANPVRGDQPENVNGP